MNDNTHSSDTGTITSKVLRRTAATVAGLAMIIGGFIASAPARADVEFLKVTATSGPTAQVSVTECYANSSGVTYRIADANGKTVTPETPLTTWNGESSFTFPVSATSPGEYSVVVTCLGYAGLGDRFGSANFTITDKNYFNFDISPKAWKTDEAVRLTATGAAPGELVTFGLNDLDGRAYYRWTAKADSAGRAELFVAWPGTEKDSNKALKPGPYELFASAASAAAPYSVRLELKANSQWVFGKPTGPAGGGGGLPNTGD